MLVEEDNLRERIKKIQEEEDKKNSESSKGIKKSRNKVTQR